jgi:HSP20 family protein
MAHEIKKPEKGSALAGRQSNPFSMMRNEIDRLFDSFMAPGWPRGAGLFREPAMLEGVIPSVDVRESPTELVLEAELPGITEKDLNVTFRDGILVIKGEKKIERDEKKDEYHLSERSYGTFERSFRLPEGIDADKISAKFDKGVLTVRAPKKPEAAKAQKKIEVKSG